MFRSERRNECLFDVLQFDGERDFEMRQSVGAAELVSRDRLHAKRAVKDVRVKCTALLSLMGGGAIFFTRLKCGALKRGIRRLSLLAQLTLQKEPLPDRNPIERQNAVQVIVFVLDGDRKQSFGR